MDAFLKLPLVRVSIVVVLLLVPLLVISNVTAPTPKQRVKLDATTPDEIFYEHRCIIIVSAEVVRGSSNFDQREEKAAAPDVGGAGATNGRDANPQQAPSGSGSGLDSSPRRGTRGALPRGVRRGTYKGKARGR